MTSSGNIIAVVAVVVAAVVTNVSAAGRQGRMRSTHQDKAPPRPSRPVITIDPQHWHRVGADWTHNARGYTYNGEVIQQRNGAVMAPHGCGRFTVPGKWVYSGQWQNGRRHGEGKYMQADGSYSYHGRLKHGNPFGYGVAIHGDGWRYEGHWVNGKRHGQGKWTDTEGQVLEGQWHQNRLHGRGRATGLADGRSLDGQFTKWDPDVAGGTFRGRVFDARAQLLIRYTDWTSKRDTLHALAAPRRLQRDENNADGGQPGGRSFPKRARLAISS